MTFRQAGRFNYLFRTVPMRLLLLPLLLLLAAQPCAAGELYRVVGPDGKVSYTDRPPSTEGLKAVKGSAAAPASTGSTDDNMGPAKAAAKVLSFQMIVDTTALSCGRQAPSSSKFIASARNEWLQRNDALVAKAGRVLRDAVSADEHGKIMRAMRQANQDLADKANSAPPEVRKSWCDQAPFKFRSDEMDPSRDAALVRTVEQYKLR